MKQATDVLFDSQGSPKATITLLSATFLMGVLVALAATASGCSSSSTSTPSAAVVATDRPAPQVLWGDMKPYVSVRELMRYMIDPLSDNIFDAVGTVVTRQGTVDREPKTDADWEKIQAGAVSIAEGISLLSVPRPFAPAGDVNNSVGPDAVELSPTQITAKVERDPVEWNARIAATRNAALNTMDVVKRRDVAGLWEAAEILDQSCEACHRSYWYPGEDAEFDKQLKTNLDRLTLHQQSVPATQPAR